VNGSVTYLTPREREILDRVARGLTNREIAEDMDLGVSTVKSHLRKTFAKLGVSNRTQAALASVFSSR
jgi:DNA-binding CsgD family transcriptional regulator